uniref:Ion transport domain-containing protein n=1 Tax=Skeletonema marinoi TaxID=267567 RepID=A0A7S2KBZ1_9STRA|mmetsp:Transcript_1128/g.1855  ORF Transcript_1128/g.1855 Transcript_1128/m.1855 type:complete len:382 (+) Transcript_1128:261-1406(+)
MPIASQLNSPIREPPPLHISRHRSDTFIENNAIDRFRQITNAESNNRTAEDSKNGDDHSYDHRDINAYRRKVGEIVHDERFDVFILILIAINSALYGVATFPSMKQNADLISDFEKVDLAILIVFTIESSMNIFYEGKRFVRDGWLMFDLVIVIISWAATKVKSLQVFRIFRAFRFLTKVQMLRNVVVALFSVVPAIAAITVLLLLILYIFSVMYTQLFKNFFEEGYTTVNYFGRLDLTLFSLFQIMCLDEWSGIAYEVGEQDYWAWLIFIIFVVMSAFVVVNLIIAVICDALQILRKAERAMLFGLSEDEAGEWEAKDNNSNEQVQTEEGRIQQRINDMHRMLDEVVASQEKMHRTIQYLSIVVNSQETKNLSSGSKVMQ